MFESIDHIILEHISNSLSHLNTPLVVGLDEQTIEVTGFTPGEWTWASTTTAGVTATLSIATSDVYTVNLLMREDGLRIDRLLLTTDTTFIPTGFGPAETDRQLGGGPLIVPITRTIVYTYDNLYRLTEADYTSGENYQYSYDKVGNRLEQVINGDTTEYLYDAANRLAQLNGQAVYSFDNNGNLLNSDTLTNTFDAANRLIETTRSGTTIEPIYNGVNDRVGQTVGLSTTNYALDVAADLPEVIYTSEGNLYLHLPGVIMAESAEGEVRYLLGDGLGSVRQAVDDTGAIVAYNEYDPYGNPVDYSPFADSPLAYTGEWWENDVQLLHLRARWYAPGTGTFLSVDPVEGEPPYQYVRGNPINQVDPSGLCQEFGDDSCWAVYDILVQNYPSLLRTRYHYQGRLVQLHELPEHRLRQLLRESWRGDPLSERQWNIAKQEARRFGLPKELVAATIAAEIVYDTDFINTLYDYSTGIVGTVADLAYLRRDRPLFNICYDLLEGFHEYFGFAPYLEPKGTLIPLFLGK